MVGLNRFIVWFVFSPQHSARFLKRVLYGLFAYELRLNCGKTILFAMQIAALQFACLAIYKRSVLFYRRDRAHYSKLTSDLLLILIQSSEWL